MIETVNASEMNLGEWDHIRQFAKKNGAKIFIGCDCGTPNSFHWSHIYLQIPQDGAEDFIVRAFNECHPDLTSIDRAVVVGEMYLKMWFD
jgi:hypothetical protein